MTQGNSVGIMVCLDSILDTRHGTIKKNFPEAFKRVRSSPKYYLRKDDRWDKLDDEIDPRVLTLGYQGRDLETIKHSQITMVMPAIVDLIHDITDRIKESDPRVGSFYMVLNTHPYNLTIEIISDIANKLLLQLGIRDLPIGFINMPWGKITPKFLTDENIGYWYCYHYEEWLRENFEPVEGEEPSSGDQIKGCPNLTMYAPMLSSNSVAMDEFIGQQKEKVYIDPFILTKAIFSNIVKFEFLPVSTFCTIDANALIKLERKSRMEKSEILSTGQKAVSSLMERLGQPPSQDRAQVNRLLGEIANKCNELIGLNDKATINEFKNGLAMLNLMVLKTYALTPFDSGLDLEKTINDLSLNVDTSESSYRETESYWNKLGVNTTLVETTLDSGETVYRCYANGDAIIDSTKATYAHMTLLEPRPYREPATSPVDIIEAGEYLK